MVPKVLMPDSPLPADPPSDEQIEELSAARGKSPRVLVAVATYNEIDNLPIFVRRLRDTLPQVDMLVIDDGSPDGTGQWCDEQTASGEKIVCLHRGGKKGLGTAVIAAMKHAVDQRYDILVNLDADLSHPPEVIPQLLTACQADKTHKTVALGSRYIPGGGVKGWPLKRHFMSRAINIYTRIFLRMQMRDCSGSFRAYPVSLIEKLDFHQFLSHGYSFFEEVLFRLKQQGANFTEVPFVFIEREHGHSKINMREAMKAVLVIGRLGLTAWWGR